MYACDLLFKPSYIIIAEVNTALEISNVLIVFLFAATIWLGIIVIKETVSDITECMEISVFLVCQPVIAVKSIDFFLDRFA